MSTSVLWVDIETRSRCDLPKAGAYRYAADPSTENLVICWAQDYGKVARWRYNDNAAKLEKFLKLYRDPRIQKRAHNAAFERLVLGAKFGPRPIEEWYCTAVQARALALPGKLEDVAFALKTTHQKDRRGAELIRLLSIPRADGTFLEDPYLLQEFEDYCATDVEAMRDISTAMAPLTPRALHEYHISEYINDVGVPIDRELCELAMGYADRESEEAKSSIGTLSGGALRTPRGTKLTQWVYDRLPEDGQKMMTVYKGGKKRMTLDADTRSNLMDWIADGAEVGADVLAVIEAADAAAMSSVSKFGAMLARADDDDRVRGAFVFNGARQTGRFSSTGAQLHNYARLVAEDPEAMLKLMRARAALPGGTLRALKSMLRPAIKPRKGFVVRADWNAVEARALPWLVDTPPATRYMGAFSDPSRDIYVEQSHAAGLGGERQPGKVVVLSMGYGGGENALDRMARNYGVTINDRPAVVQRWRGANKWAVGWWRKLSRAALDALVNGGAPVPAGRVAFTGHSNWLSMTLPCGRDIWYPEASVVEGEYGYQIEYLKAGLKPKAGAEEWPRARLWHGLLAENADQATCASLLRDALVRGWEARLPVIGHVHDEVICEARTAKQAKEVGKALEACMLSSGDWAKGLPLRAEVDISERFRK